MVLSVGLRGGVVRVQTDHVGWELRRGINIIARAFHLKRHRYGIYTANFTFGTSELRGKAPALLHYGGLNIPT